MREINFMLKILHSHNVLGNMTILSMVKHTFDWTANDHSPIVKDIIWQDLRSLSFYFFVCPCVCVSVCLSALCTPQFWSHKLVDPYLGSLYSLDAIKKKNNNNNFDLKVEKKTPIFCIFRLNINEGETTGTIQTNLIKYGQLYLFLYMFFSGSDD